MELVLTVTAGPHRGKEFRFSEHDTFLVGRVEEAHLRLTYDDPYFSRRHFVIEMNPPRCRVMDLKSRNGLTVNGKKVAMADIADGDEISAGHTTFKVSVSRKRSTAEVTLDAPTPGSTGAPAVTLDLPPNATPIKTGSYHPPRKDPMQSEAFEVSDFVLPGYRIEQELGKGGMGIVYRAVRERDGLPVAIKTITPHIGVTRKQVDRFMRECKILSELSHANVVGFHGLEEVDGTVCLIMELVEGKDAAAMLKESGPMKVKTAVRLVCQILGGLAHAHERGFVHRDIKPGNVLVGKTEDGKKAAKLADFGLARVYEASKLSGLTMQGDIGGTPAYMAPEQVTHYRDVKPAADQYSVAAMLYTLLTSHVPHDLPRDCGMSAVLIHIATEPPVPIRDRRADVPAALAAVIHKALAREPRERYEDVGALRKSLHGFV